jgi:hypothetical protein
MKRSSRPRKTAFNLSNSLHQQLNMYARVASAARGELAGISATV